MDEGEYNMNVGNKDKVVRAILVVGITIAAVLTQQWWLLLFSVMLTITIFTGFCGIYAFLGIRTCPYKPTVKK